MINLIQNPPGSEATLPDGSIILWWSNASSIPSGWSVYSAASGRFIQGAVAANLTESGSFTHSHTNSTLGAVGDHQHTVGLPTPGSTGGDVAAYGGEGVKNYDTCISHSHSISVSNYDADGGHLHTMGNTNEVTVYPSYRRLYWMQCSGDQPIPVGGIIMYGLDYVNRPDGFNLCNGGSYNDNTTPDMRGRFVYSASEDDDVNYARGSYDHVHSQPNTGSDGSHDHYIQGTMSGFSGTVVEAGQISEGAVDCVPKDHTHSWSAVTNADADHSHSVPDTGSGSSLPAYVKLYYLMRTI